MVLVVHLQEVVLHHQAVHLVAVEVSAVGVSVAGEQVEVERLAGRPLTIISRATASPATSLVIGSLTVRDTT